MSKRINYAVYPGFVFRVPGLPLSSLNELPKTPEQLERFIREKWMVTGIKEAFFLASESFASALEAEVMSNHAISSALGFSFLNYYTRFCTRPTPFGLFAGIGAGTVSKSSDTCIELEAFQNSQVRIQMDMDLLQFVLHCLESDEGLMRAMKFRKSDILYPVGNQWRLYEKKSGYQGKQSFSLSVLEGEPILNGLLHFSAGFREYQEIISFIVDKGYASAEAEAYLTALVRNRILVSHLEVVLSGVDYQTFLADQLKQLKISHPLLSKFNAIHKDLEHLTQVDQSLARIRALKSFSDKIGNQSTRGRLNYSICYRPAASAVLSEELCHQVLKGIRILRALSRQPETDRLGYFKRLFYQRYGDASVPLAEVMDQEIGIGLRGSDAQQLADPAPLLDDLSSYGSRVQNRSVDRKKGFDLHQKLLYDQSEGHFLELSNADINSLDIHGFSEWPRQLYALFGIGQGNGRSEVYMQYASGGHPIKLLGRFAWDPTAEIRQFVQTVVRDEVDALSDYLVADLSYLPESRTGNILQHPDFYAYEINLLSQSVKPKQFQISWQEIKVRLEEEEVVLWSEHHQKKILPRLSHAYNFKMGKLPIYEFLVEVGMQHDPPSYQLGLSNWDRAEFCPGVRYQNTILKLPEWRLKTPHSESLTPAFLSAWAASKRLPDQACLVEGDRDYFIDWKNPLLVEKLCKHIQNWEFARFQLFPFRQDTQVKENGLSYTNQLIVCFHQMN